MSASRLSAAMARVVAIDLRALAACRMGLGAVLLFDLWQWICGAGAWLTDDGIMTVAAAREAWNSPWKWSLHFVDGGWAWQVVLLVLAVAAAALWTAGWWTTTAGIVSWVLLVSRHARAPLAITGGDWLLRLLMFWLWFLPSGRRWSVDAVRGSGVGGEGLGLGRRNVASVASAAVLVQLAAMYFFTGIWKWNDVWLSGEALQRAVTLQTWTRPLAAWLAEFPELLRGLAWGTLALELIGPWLLFVPWKTNYFRLAAVTAFVGLHVGIELCLSVGIFSYAALAGWLLFLPSGAWDGVERVVVRVLECGRRVRSMTGVAARGEVPSAKGFASHSCRSSPSSENGSSAVWCWGWICAVVVGGLLGFMVYFNVAGLPGLAGYRESLMPAAVWDAAYALHLEQRWSMFDRPATHDGWFVARGSLRDGRVVDLLRPERAVDGEYPGDVFGGRRNQQWQKLFNNLTLPEYVGYRQGVTEYLAREWNARHAVAEQALVVELLYYLEDKRPEVGLSDVRLQPAFGRARMGTTEETDELAELLRKLKREGGR